MRIARDQQLDGLRAVAVSMVVYAHFYAEDGSHWGHIGVRLFFILSGFLITRLLLEARDDPRYEPATALRSFYARRSLRILPPYFAVLAAVWLIGLESSEKVLVWHALYLSNFWYALQDAWSPWVLCHTWSLSIEEQFYIVWPLIVLTAPRRSIGAICVGVICCSLAFRFYWPVTGTPTLARDLLPPASMDALAAGALLAVHRSSGAAMPNWAERCWKPLLIVSLFLFSIRTVPTTPLLEWFVWIGLEVFPLLPLTLLVGACSQGIGGYLGRLAQAPPVTALGRISYGVYLYHAVVLALLVQAQAFIPINVSEQGAGRLVVTGAATLLLASISWIAFERPLNALKRHFPYARGASSAPVAAEAEGVRPVYPGISVEHGKALQVSNTR
ncbi:hypothetical protein SJ05684_b51900 (plasmid) [Sinorhizobium sojae CCBAU 05684]|uniref:Acyltransferase 3 domain-containing protein n=1 Tax=Sinorhizobium sojae CCBAU 05684 TaxID=716928 RepID=A0A249PKA1_9HYPH|nr:acyltransferase [Sinorhizobium sojae]ASY66172.1 hypothetical protein SJ05684_b51900 [Sinorhizobium sojae CCBAU 05684]